MDKPENICKNGIIPGKMASLAIINTMEMIGASVLAGVMLGLLFYIFFQIRTKNMWSDLQGIERKLLKALIAICALAGICNPVSIQRT